MEYTMIGFSIKCKVSALHDNLGLMSQWLMDMYKDWVNNYLTIEKFAEHKNLTEAQAEQIIELGRTTWLYNNK